MEASSEPQLDAKAKVTNQTSINSTVTHPSLPDLESAEFCRFVMLKVADHSGQVKNKSFEMTIPQFQNFYRQFKEIAAIIETV